MKPSEPGAGALRLPEDSRGEAGGHFVVEASRLDSRRQTIRDDRVVRHG